MAATDAQRRRLTVGRTDPTIASVRGADSGTKLCQMMRDKEFEGGGKVTCVHSITDADMKKKRSFAEKDRAGCKNGEDLTGPDLKDSPIPGLNYTCKKGLKPESPNQDSFVMIQMPTKWSLFGVFDGHGPNGHDVSDFAVKALVDRFFQEEFIADTGAAFTTAFLECQNAIENHKAMDAKSSGSTCTMAFHNMETDVLTIAHVGDSRSVLFSGDVPGEVKHETEDHKPNLPAEKARIEKKGGRVVFDGYYNYRVFAKAGMYPGLNMSRALGDVVAHKEAGLTAEPELKVINLKETRKDKPLTLLLCSDGVWEFINSGDALTRMDFASGTTVGTDKLQEGVDKLAKKSWDSWMEDSDNEISDDITVMAVML